MKRIILLVVALFLAVPTIAGFTQAQPNTTPATDITFSDDIEHRYTTERVYEVGQNDVIGIYNATDEYIIEFNTTEDRWNRSRSASNLINYTSVTEPVNTQRYNYTSSVKANEPQTIEVFYPAGVDITNVSVNEVLGDDGNNGTIDANITSLVTGTATNGQNLTITLDKGAFKLDSGDELIMSITGTEPAGDFEVNIDVNNAGSKVDYVDEKGGGETYTSAHFQWNRTGHNTYLTKVNDYWYDYTYNADGSIKDVEATFELGVTDVQRILADTWGGATECKDDGRYPEPEDCLNMEYYWQGGTFNASVADSLDTERTNFPIYVGNSTGSWSLDKTTNLDGTNAKNITAKAKMRGDGKAQFKLGSNSIVVTVAEQVDWNQGTFFNMTSDQMNNSGDLQIGTANLTAGLQAHYRMDRNSTHALDYSQPDFTAERTGNVIMDAPGIRGTYGADSDGIGNFFTAQNIDIDSTTIETWVNPDSYTNQETSDVTLVMLSTNNWMRVDSETKELKCKMRNEANTQYTIQGGEVFLDEWSHVACQYNNATGNFSAWINKELVASQITGGNLDIPAIANTTIIGSQSGDRGGLDGTIDEVKIWDNEIPRDDFNYFTSGRYESEQYTYNTTRYWDTLEIDIPIFSNTVNWFTDSEADFRAGRHNKTAPGDLLIPDTNIGVGGSSGEQQMYTASLDLEWSEPIHISAVRGLDTGVEFTYSGGADSDLDKVWTDNGTINWVYTDTDSDTILDIDDAVDSVDYVFYADNDADIAAVWKGNGTLAYEYEHAGAAYDVTALEADQADYMYMGTSDGDFHRHWIANNTEDFPLTKLYDNNEVYDMAESAISDTVYVAVGDKLMQVWANNGTIIWEDTHTREVLDVETHLHGGGTQEHVYASTGGATGSIEKHHANGTFIWEYTTDQRVNSITVDEAGMIYAGGEDGLIEKVEPGGTLTDSFQTDLAAIDVIDASQSLDGGYTERNTDRYKKSGAYPLTNWTSISIDAFRELGAINMVFETYRDKDFTQLVESHAIPSSQLNNGFAQVNLTNITQPTRYALYRINFNGTFNTRIEKVYVNGTTYPVEVEFRSINETGSIVDTQRFNATSGLANYTLSVEPTNNSEIVLDGYQTSPLDTFSINQYRLFHGKYIQNSQDENVIANHTTLRRNQLGRSESEDPNSTSYIARHIDLDRSNNVLAQIVSIADRLIDLNRSVLENILAITTSDRVLDLDRAQQDIITSAMIQQRAIDLDRDQDENITSTGNDDRLIDLNRSNQTGPTFTALQRRFIDADRSNSITVTSIADAARLLDLDRSESELITAFTLSDRTIDLDRSEQELLTAYADAARLIDLQRSETNGVVSIADAARRLAAERQDNAAVFGYENSLRLLDLDRNQDEAVNGTATNNRELLLDRAVTTPIVVSMLDNRVIDLDRSEFVVVNITDADDRTITVQRTQQEIVDGISLSDRLIDIDRGAFAAGNITANDSRLGLIDASFLAAITANANDSRLIDIDRSAVGAGFISMLDDRRLIFGRSEIDNIVAVSDDARNTDSDRTETNTPTITFLADRQIDIDRANVVDIIAGIFDARNLDLDRSTTDTINATTDPERALNNTRSAVDTAILTALSDRQIDIDRSSFEFYTVVGTDGRDIIVQRAGDERINATSLSDRTLTALRDANAVSDVFALPNRVLLVHRNADITGNVTATDLRFADLDRDQVDDANLSALSNRLLRLEREHIDSELVFALDDRRITFARTGSADVTGTAVIDRALSLGRDETVEPNPNAGSSRLIDIDRSVFDTSTVNALSSRIVTYDERATAIFNASAQQDRMIELQRAETDVVEVDAEKLPFLTRTIIEQFIRDRLVRVISDTYIIEPGRTEIVQLRFRNYDNIAKTVYIEENEGVSNACDLIDIQRKRNIDKFGDTAEIRIEGADKSDRMYYEQIVKARIDMPPTVGNYPNREINCGYDTSASIGDAEDFYIRARPTLTFVQRFNAFFRALAPGEAAKRGALDPVQEKTICIDNNRIIERSNCTQRMFVTPFPTEAGLNMLLGLGILWYFLGRRTYEWIYGLLARWYEEEVLYLYESPR